MVKYLYFALSKVEVALNDTLRRTYLHVLYLRHVPLPDGATTRLKTAVCLCHISAER